MKNFSEAIKIAETNAKALLPNASNFELEAAVVSNDNKNYEITLSYDIEGKNPLNLDQNASGLMQLAMLMRHRREYKVFFVKCSDGQFMGFKKYNDK